MMFKRDCYLVNSKTILVTSQFGSFGQHYTRVFEDETTFVVKKSPKEVINSSFPMGNDLKSALNSAKKLLGWKSMPPIVVNPFQKVCLVPFGAPENHYTLWINPEKVLHTTNEGGHTMIHFKNHCSLPIQWSLKTVNHRFQGGTQLMNLVLANGFIETPQKSKIIIPQMEDGSYNFDVFLERLQKSKMYSPL